MKRMFFACIVLFLLVGCSSVEPGKPEVTASPPGNGSGVSGTPEITQPVVPAESGDMITDNPAPIPLLKDLAFDDVAAVLFWQEQAAENIMYPLNGREQEKAVLNRLKQVQLSGKPDAKVKLVPTLKYDVCLKNGETIHIGFAGKFVTFGVGAYLYESCDKSLFPQDIARITFDNADSQYCYEDASDIRALMDLLTPAPWIEPAEFKGDGVLLSFSLLPRGALPEESYVIEIPDVPICLYKSFFTLKTCLGLIGIDDYTQLEIARNGQFGTKLHFTAASGGRTIYPAGHFVCSTTYSEEAGCMVAGDAFPRFEDYGLVEELTLAGDFSIWIKEADMTRYKIAQNGKSLREGRALTLAGFEGLEPGVYQTEVYVTRQGRYIEELGEYESSTSVYYFLVSIR